MTRDLVIVNYDTFGLGFKVKFQEASHSGGHELGHT